MDNKGISPLIAAVLLIAFTIAIATVIMGWMSTTTRATTGTITTKTATAVDCSDASIQIKHVYINNNTSDGIFVCNTGFKDLTVDGVIYSTTGATCDGTAANISAGACGMVSSPSCSAVNASTFDRAVVSTDCGGVTDTLTDSSYVN